MKFSYKNQLILFLFINIVTSIIYVSFTIFNNVDIGQEELNFWYNIYIDKELSIFGGNYYWIFLLDFFGLLPIITTFDVIGVFTTSKLIQIGLVWVAIRNFKPSAAWLLLLFLPNCFLYSNSMGRSSLDWSIAFALAVVSLNNKYLHIGLACFSLFHKFLLFAIASVALISDRISKVNGYFFKVFIFLFIFLLFIFYSSDLLDLANYNFLIAEYGNYAIKDNASQINGLHDYFLRSFAIVLPPFFQYQDIIAFIFSIDAIVLGLILIKNRRFLNFTEYFTFSLILFSAVPFVYNYLSAARYFSVLLLFVALRVLIRRSAHVLGNRSDF
jgi:hypothetical protein